MMYKLVARSSELIVKKQKTKKAALVFSLIIFISVSALKASFAQVVSSTELINKAKELDGKTIVYQGEVIGDVMKRGNFAWVNANDGQNAIGIWMDYSLAKEIAYMGSYKFIGDVIEVSGIFNRACPEHGGDLDIHAQTLRKIESGRPVPEKLTRAKRNTTLILIGILGLLWILYQLRRK